MPCINVLGPFSPFQSPWARKKEDEDYLSRTLTRLGEIVKDDVKLGTVYLTLVLATPPSEATEETKASTEQDEVENILFLIDISSPTPGWSQCSRRLACCSTVISPTNTGGTKTRRSSSTRTCEV